MTYSPSTLLSVALVASISSTPTANAFSNLNVKAYQNRHQCSSVELKYRSLHHGPDIEPLTDMEKLGQEYTKLSKDKIDRFGPGDFNDFSDFPMDQFDGGDSDMGLSGDGIIGLQKLGRDVSPHLARTLTAKIEDNNGGFLAASSVTYADELLQANPGMNSVRAQQYENWATQKEIALSNRIMNVMAQDNIYQYGQETEYYEEYDVFSSSIEAGEELAGIISLRAPLNGVARHDIMLKNPYMGFAKFRAGFVGDACNDWSVTPNDGFLKQNEETYFAVSFNPRNPGTYTCYLVIETEDFKMTWKVVGSTGEYEF